jgi:triphosphoribosyl-dephospho-CoA synthetase
MSGEAAHGTLFKTGPFSDEEDMQLRAILRDELEVSPVRLALVLRKKKKKNKSRRSVLTKLRAEAECGVE